MKNISIFPFWIVIMSKPVLNYTSSYDFQAAVEEGIVVGGGCTLLRLSSKVDAIKETLDNDEEKVMCCINFKILLKRINC